MEALGRKIERGVTQEEEQESLMGSGVRSQEATHQFSSLARVPRTPIFPLGALGNKIGERRSMTQESPHSPASPRGQPQPGCVHLQGDPLAQEIQEGLADLGGPEMEPEAMA